MFVNKIWSPFVQNFQRQISCYKFGDKISKLWQKRKGITRTTGSKLKKAKIYHHLLHQKVWRCKVPCPPKKEEKIIIAKACSVCSFEQQARDNCLGKPWKLPQLKCRPNKPRIHFCKPQENCEVCVPEEDEEDEHEPEVFKKYRVPPCPKSNWECKR